MDRDGHETFDEMVGPIVSPLERLRLKAALHANQTVGSLRLLALKKVPFLLPVRGPLSGLDGAIQVAVHVLSHDPLLIYTSIGGPRPLNSIAAISRRLASRRAVFLMIPSWTLERPHVVEKLGRDLAWHRERFPRHELIFLATPRRNVAWSPRSEEPRSSQITI